ncbi:MAG: PepSY domain-containing protein [Lachnospiraceae bacterium]|nr:PepSY domain-containing protein [Lachnospiraceae bacterium]
MSRGYKFLALGLATAALSGMTVFTSARELPATVFHTAAIMTEQAKEIVLGHAKTGQVLSQRDADDAVITLERAKEIAFAHAGIDGTEAVFSKEKRDKGVYELKFRNKEDKYEYEIAAADGQILYYEWDIEEEKTDVSAADRKGSISEEEACRIALESADFDEENLKYMTCYVVWKEHLPYAYEVKFAPDMAPYDNYRYTVDLYTGDVLEGGCVASQPKSKNK